MTDKELEELVEYILLADTGKVGYVPVSHNGMFTGSVRPISFEEYKQRRRQGQ